MYIEDSCPCCGSKNLSLLPAVVAPFIAAYAVGSAPFQCALAECKSCSFRFFNSRLTPEEVGRLYSGYRGNDYFRSRHDAEPWYSRKVNDGIAADPAEVEIRNGAMEKFLQAQISGGEVTSVIDYGGDRGQFIPKNLGTEKFVFEVSDARPVAGVTRISSEEELQNRKFDLALLLGVLEHCSSPIEILQAVKALLKGKQSYLVIAVPYEWYDLKAVSKGSLYRKYLNLLLGSSLLLKAVDFYSTAFRVRAYRIPPLGILKCHEHLNFFNEKSITSLLHRAGLELVKCSTTQTCTYPARTFSLSVLARPMAN